MVCAPDYSKGNGPALLSASGVECKSGAKTGQFNWGIADTHAKKGPPPLPSMAHQIPQRHISTSTWERQSPSAPIRLNSHFTTL